MKYSLLFTNPICYFLLLFLSFLNNHLPITFLIHQLNKILKKLSYFNSFFGIYISLVNQLFETLTKISINHYLVFKTICNLKFYFWIIKKQSKYQINTSSIFLFIKLLLTFLSKWFYEFLLHFLFILVLLKIAIKQLLLNHIFAMLHSTKIFLHQFS